MAIVPIPINKGAFQNVGAIELASPEYATDLRNILINDAGSNVHRPGLRDFASLVDFPVIGLTFFNNLLFAVTENRKMFSITSAGVVTNVTGSGDLEGAKRPVFASDGTYLAIAGGGSPKRWNGIGNVEDMPGSPPDCTHISYLDGYWLLHLLADQELRWAGPTSSLRESWNSSNFFQAEALPDNIVTH